MTDEEIKAIQIIEDIKESIDWDCKENIEKRNAVETILNLIQKQQEELENKDYKIHIMKTEMERPEKLKIELNKKDKVIEELVDKIYRMDYRNEYGNTRNQIKENFYKKVEGK